MGNVLELKDERIESTNFIFQISIKDYLGIAEKSLESNEFQRRKVKNSNSVYALLKEDLLRGCIIPPIVLAITDENTVGNITKDNIENKIKEVNVLILDGLQRTLTLLELVKELKEHTLLSNPGNVDSLEKLYSHKIRLEVYVGLNKLGILYRMLTLNTGQTPMSLRQQIEMLYLSYLNQDIEGVKLIKETEGQAVSSISEYKFNDVVEGFNSYLERNELPMIKADILENIKSLEKLSKEDTKDELFSNFIQTWNSLLLKINELCNEQDLEDDSDLKKVFFKNIPQLFKKAQSISGFGAAVGRLIDYELLNSFDDIKNVLDSLTLTVDPDKFLIEMNKKFEWIDNNSKKIGNAQRMFLQYYFRELFNKDNENYLKLYEAINPAFMKYQSQNF